MISLRKENERLKDEIAQQSLKIDVLKMHCDALAQVYSETELLDEFIHHLEMSGLRPTTESLKAVMRGTPVAQVMIELSHEVPA